MRLFAFILVIILSETSTKYFLPFEQEPIQSLTVHWICFCIYGKERNSIAENDWLMYSNKTSGVQYPFLPDYFPKNFMIFE